MSILYYLGITQTVAAKMGWFVQITMKTTAIESLGVAANIFLNGVRETEVNIDFDIDFEILKVRVERYTFTNFSDCS